METKGEDEPKFEMIPDLELGEDEQFQYQPSRGMKVLMDNFYIGDIEVTKEQPQQLEEVGRQDVVTQEPTPLKTLVEAATQMEVVDQLLITT